MKFYEDADKVITELENLEKLLKEAETEDKGPEIEEKWQNVQHLYDVLSTTGHQFIDEARKVNFKFLIIC